MAGPKREQLNDIESATNTRQDRGLHLTDGGTLTWDSATGTLTWSGTLRLRVPSVGGYAATAGALVGILAVGDSVYVSINRVSSGVMTLAILNIVNSAFLSDDYIILATRGADGKLYFRNGTVFTSGDSKAFGMLNTATDRSEVVADGLALQAVGFNYVVAKNQLTVYVGGILQVLGTHYTETSSSQITFLAPYIPSAGELITYLNIIGGEGPAGTPDLQQAYTSGNQINLTPGTPVELTSTAGLATTALMRAGHASSAGGLNAVVMTRDGQILSNRLALRDYTSGTYFFIAEVDASGNARVRSLTPGNEYGVQINADGSGIEFGIFPSLGAPGTTGGAFRASTFTGLTSAVGPTIVGTGLSTIKSVSASVYSALVSRYLVSGFADAQNAQGEFYITFDALGNVRISGNPNGTGVVPVGLQGQTYNLVVFH